MTRITEMIRPRKGKKNVTVNDYKYGRDAMLYAMKWIVEKEMICGEAGIDTYTGEVMKVGFKIRGKDGTNYELLMDHAPSKSGA